MIIADRPHDARHPQIRHGASGDGCRDAVLGRMRPVPDTVPFSRSDALRCGWSDAALTRAVRAGRIRRVRRGYFAVDDQQARSTADRRRGHLVAALAAARASSLGVISHRSALLLHDLPLLGAAPREPELTVPPLGPCNLPHSHVYRASLPAEHVALVGRDEVTSVARTVVDVGRHRPRAATVAAADAALHRGLTSLDELYDVLRTCWNWPGIRRAARAVRLADGLAESPLESVSRLVLTRLHLPPPRPQAPIFDEFGRFVGRADFYWDQFGVIGEADGRGKYDGRPVLTDEKLRQQELEALGLIAVRWGWDDAVHHPHTIKYRLERAYERGRLRDRSGFTRLWSVPPP